METDDQTIYQPITPGNTYIVNWPVTQPPDDSPLGGVREPRKPRPGAPAIPAAAELSYTGS